MLPKPKPGETREAFTARALADPTVQAAADEADRAALVAQLYDWKPGRFDRALAALAPLLDDPVAAAEFRAAGVTIDAAQFKQTPGAQVYSWDVEVFAVGTWNGYRFTAEDLQKMVASFEALHGAGYLDAPLKFGHNDEQPVTDGAPAIGWVDRLYIKDDKLMATFADVPQVVYDAAKARRYRKVSIELDFDVKHKGVMYPYVLTGVALLGADLPAVNTLADLHAYMTRDPLVAARKATFSAVDSQGTPHKPEGRTMAEIDDKELQALRDKAAKAEKLEADNAKFAADAQAREAREAADKVKAARGTINGLLDKAVEDMRIQPAQRAGFAKLLRVDDDAAVVTISTEDVEAVLPAKAAGTGKPGAFSQQRGSGSADDKDSTDDQIDAEVRKLMAGDSKLTYTKAYDRLATTNPDLMRKHLVDA